MRNYENLHCKVEADIDEEWVMGRVAELRGCAAKMSKLAKMEPSEKNVRHANLYRKRAEGILRALREAGIVIYDA